MEIRTRPIETTNLINGEKGQFSDKKAVVSANPFKEDCISSANDSDMYMLDLVATFTPFNPQVRTGGTDSGCTQTDSGCTSTQSGCTQTDSGCRQTQNGC